MSEENAKVTGFHSISTVSYRGFSETVLRELEQYLHKISGSTKARALMDFFVELDKHLVHNPKAHNLDISQWSEELLNQLFNSYRECGFTGTRKDMILGIEKLITVASELDVQAGYSTVKALNVLGWQTYFHDHQADRKSHLDRFSTLYPRGAVNKEPLFYFSHMFKENYEPYEDDGYTLDCWNPKAGSLVLDTTLNYDEDLTIFTIEGIDWYLVLQGAIVNGIDTIELVLHRNTDVTKIISYSLKTNNTLQRERLVMSFDNKIVHIKSQLTESSNPLLLPSFPVAIKLNQPLVRGSRGIREILYYPFLLGIEEQLHFLND